MISLCLSRKSLILTASICVGVLPGRVLPLTLSRSNLPGPFIPLMFPIGLRSDPESFWLPHGVSQ
uniref:Uncharacterized protein n=1 Tax=Calypogeia fissa associated deltaflexivirus TaxID=2933106 RepID=A0A9C7GX32_9VIRU|nr:hypothetical protein 4 [Calypogeia fissa associated deltaflexivirus]CAI5383919.1 hypothetical protein 4 [Calypogeia fissa associated deltaflexivirus]